MLTNRFAQNVCSSELTAKDMIVKRVGLRNEIQRNSDAR